MHRSQRIQIYHSLPTTNRDASIVPKTSVELAFKDLRRGTQENAEVILALKCQQSCSVVDANSGAVRTVAAELRFDRSTGILVGPAHLQDKRGETFLLNGSAVKVLGQTVSATGVSKLHMIDVTIPLRVVEHNARVETEASYLRGPSSTRVVLTVLLAPVLLVVGIVGLLTGWDC